jgi:hypothetical protein
MEVSFFHHVLLVIKEVGRHVNVFFPYALVTRNLSVHRKSRPAIVFF